MTPYTQTYTCTINTWFEGWFHFVLFYEGRVSCCPGILYADEAGPELPDPRASASAVLNTFSPLKECAPHPALVVFFLVYRGRWRGGLAGESACSSLPVIQLWFLTPTSGGSTIHNSSSRESVPLASVAVCSACAYTCGHTHLPLYIVKMIKKNLLKTE